MSNSTILLVLLEYITTCPLGAASTQPTAKRAVGRPRSSTNAARDPSQQRIPIAAAPGETPQTRREDAYKSPDEL